MNIFGWLRKRIPDPVFHAHKQASIARLVAEIKADAVSRPVKEKYTFVTEMPQGMSLFHLIVPLLMRLPSHIECNEISSLWSAEDDRTTLSVVLTKLL